MDKELKNEMKKVMKTMLKSLDKIETKSIEIYQEYTEFYNLIKKPLEQEDSSDTKRALELLDNALENMGNGSDYLMEAFDLAEEAYGCVADIKTDI